MNKVFLIGRLVRDPELRYTQSGVPVCNFTLAIDRQFTNQSGEREADFIDIVVWRKSAENVAKYMGKGKRIAVDGSLQICSYKDSNGIRRKAAEVVANRVEFLDYKDSGKRTDSAIGTEVSFSEDEIDSIFGSHDADVELFQDIPF